MPVSSPAVFARQILCASGLTLASIVTACGPSNRGASDSAVAMRYDSTAAGNSSPDSASGRTRSLQPSSEQQGVLDALGSLGGKPIETLTAIEARQQPSPTDAVMAVLKKNGESIAPETVGSVVNRTIPSTGGALPVRIYTPAGAGPFPVIVYYHGGGWVIATNDTYDGSARALTNAVNAVLVSVEYRKAPEYKFPAAHDDAFAAYEWVIKNAGSLKGDPSRIALAGESAGGNLAIATAMTARDGDMPVPLHILAVYPIAGIDTTTDSYTQNAAAKPLSRPMMNWFFNMYAPTPKARQDPRINLLGANLKGLPPVTIISAEMDPLRTEGEQLAVRLSQAGVQVEQRTFPGTAHEFFGQGAVVPQAKEAVKYGATGIKDAFQKKNR